MIAVLDATFDTTLVLALTKAATLVFGTLLTYLSWRAYRRTGAPALRALTVGIGLVTTGAVVGGLLHQFLGIGIVAAAGVQSVFTATGFAVLTYSLYAEGTSESQSDSSREPVGRGG